ncbi:MAG: hypothetical protein IKJ89_08880 [Kiritimatiellae bacterium]|nr:hypothetical protein [Kiritimatiellia bacterium]
MNNEHSIQYWRESPWNHRLEQEGTPFFLAVANDRREIVRELIRKDAFRDPGHTGGTSAVHIEASLLSIAVQHWDFELADWLVEKGCLHEDMYDLPNDSHAWDGRVTEYVLAKWRKIKEKERGRSHARGWPTHGARLEYCATPHSSGSSGSTCAASALTGTHEVEVRADYPVSPKNIRPQSRRHVKHKSRSASTKGLGVRLLS